VNVPPIQQMRLLIVDDEQANVALLRGMLERSGYEQVFFETDAREVEEVFARVQPDLLVLDYHMPHLNGLEVASRVQRLLPPGSYFPILMLTADARPELKEEALARGAKDFLTKPLSATEVKLRIKNLLEARAFHRALQAHSEELERKVQARTRQLDEAQVEMLIRLAKAGEFRDDESGEHVWRVAHTSMLLARELGLPFEQCELILRAARLHDVGKIGIPDGILYKPSRLNEAEFAVVKAHTLVGAQLLSGGRSPLMKMAETIALTHHERWDGSGYPQGLAGEAIPIEGRILAVADAFDALTHDRPHQRARSPEEAAIEIEVNASRQFDPQVVEAFLRLFDRGELVPVAQAV
jgi:putative two-component system response regulator